MESEAQDNDPRLARVESRQVRLLAAIADNAPIGIWFLDADQKIPFMNPAGFWGWRGLRWI
jgi:PAS domain-containing protein